METNSLSDTSGNVQTLRNMWSAKVQEQEKPSRPASIPTRPYIKQQKSENKSPEIDLSTSKIINQTKQKESPVSPLNEKTTSPKSREKLPPTEETIYLSFPLPPPLKQQIPKQSIDKTPNNEKKDFPSGKAKHNGIHHWHITRHVFRSGLVFNHPRRASDSIVPLLMKTHQANQLSRTDSLNSTHSQTPFENLVDYLTYEEEHRKNCLNVYKKTRRSTSDASDCIRRNKLDDSIFQYEMLLRHVKNHDQFMSTHPVTLSIATKRRKKSLDNNEQMNYSLTNTKERVPVRSSMSTLQTQSLSRNFGRTFLDFINNDLFVSGSTTPKRISLLHASSQTESIKPILSNEEEIVHNSGPDRINSISNDEEAKDVLNEFDTMLDQHLPITPNSEVNVIILNPSAVSNVETKQTIEKPLIQRLFEGNKTAYTPDDLDMKSIRLPEDLLRQFDIAKNKFFFDTEKFVYVATMLKVRRRSYVQRPRMICITTERVYHLTRKNPYSKEGSMLNEIRGITCTPYQDGFICIHTNGAPGDRGDWLIVVDHPCEFITQLFIAMKRENNDDHFLKFRTEFTHSRRFHGESTSSTCSITVRTADSFRIKKVDFASVIIFTP